MSSTPFDAPLRIEYRAPRRLVALVAFFHFGAGALLTTVPISPPLAAGLGMAVAASLAVHWRRLRTSRPTVTWGTDGRWTWDERGAVHILDLAGDTFVSPSLVVLNLREPNRGVRKSLVLFPGTIPDDTFRRLRVRLGMERKHPES